MLVLSKFLIFLTKIIKLSSYLDFPRNDFLTLERLKFRNALTQCAGVVLTRQSGFPVLQDLKLQIEVCER